MILGLSGYIGSGKSTVAMLIQALTMPQKGRWYHDPLEYAKGYEGRPNLKGGWEIKAYAGKLKQMVSLLTGIPVEDLEKQEVKQSELGKEWSWVPKALQLESRHWVTIPGAVHPEMEDRTRKMTVRELLQKLGTEACRNVIHEDIWVNALFVDYRGKWDIRESSEPPYLKKYPDIYPNWVISDTRFPNEAQAIKDRGGIVVRINRPVIGPDSLTGKTLMQEPRHSSETSLDNWGFDYTIDNSGSLEDLLERVREMLLHFKIIQ